MNPNEPNLTPPVSQEAPKPFPYLEFQKILENPMAHPDDLRNYLARKDTVERFTKPLQTFFPPKEQNIGEAWKNFNVVTFAFDNTPINKAALDLMTQYSTNLNLSIIKVYEYLNIVLKNNPDVVRAVSRPDISTHYQAMIEAAIVNLVMKDRIALLRGIYAVVVSLEQNPSDRLQVIEEFIAPLAESNTLISVLIESYYYNDYRLALPFYRKNPDIYITAKLKEEFLVLSSIFVLFSQRKVRKDLPKIYERLFGIFLKQKFEGSLTEIMDQLKLSLNNISKVNNEVSDKNGILMLFILLSGIFSEWKTTDSRYEQINLPHLITLNKAIATLLKGLEESAKVPKIIFFQNIYTIILKASLSGLTSENSMLDVNILESTIRDLELVPDDSFAENILKFIDSTKKFKQPTVDSFRDMLKFLLEIFSILNLAHQEILNDIFINKDIKNSILLKIFKEAMKSGKILCEFWQRDFEEDTQIGYFYKEFLYGFPYDKLNFLKVVDAILGSKLYPFSDEVIEILSKLSKVTVEVNNRMEFSSKDLSKSKYRIQQEGLELRGPINIGSDITIPEGTNITHKYGYPNVVEAQVTVNFWELMYKELTDFICSNQGVRKVILPDYIAKYLKLIAKILIVTPNLSQKIQGVMLANNRNQMSLEPSTQYGATPLLYFILFDAFRLIHERPEYSKISCLLLQAVKSLIISQNGQAALFFINLYPLISDTDVTPVHVLLDFFNTFKTTEGSFIDSFRLNERYFYRALTDIVNIFKIIISDEDIWVSSIIGIGDVGAKDSTGLQSNSEGFLKRLAELYIELTTENSWFERAEEIQSSFADLFNLREFVSTNIVNELWNNLVVPLSRRFVKDDFDVTQEHAGFKYNLYKALFELINVLLLKINYLQGKAALRVEDVKEDLKARYIAKLTDYVDGLPLRDMLIESLEVIIDSSRVKQPVLASQQVALGIVNKHWSLNVERRKNFLVQNDILDFLITSLETLALVALVCRLEIQHGAQKEESNLLKSFLKDFCFRESIYKYKFDSPSDMQSVNIIVALISLIILENEKEKLKFSQKAGIIENTVAPFSNYDWRYSHSLFPEPQDGNKFLFYVNLDLLFARALDVPKTMERPRSVIEAGLQALTEVLCFWHLQQKVKKPNLEDYVFGLHNDLPNGRVIMERFSLALTFALGEGYTAAFDFLLELQKFQPRFLEEYMRIGEAKEGRAKNSIIGIYTGVLKQLSKMSKISKVSFKFLNATENMFKFALFILRVLRSKRISKNIVDQLWSAIFESLVENVFSYISLNKDSFESAFEFLYDLLTSGKFEYFDWSSSLNLTFNVLRFYQLVKLSRVQDKLLGELMDLVCWAFMEKLCKKSVHFTDRYALDFLKHYSQHSQKLIESAISDTVFSGHKLMSIIQNDVLEDILSDLNTKCAKNRWNANLYKSALHNQLNLSADRKYVYFDKPASKSSKEAEKSSGPKPKSSFDSLAIYLLIRSFGLSQFDAGKLAYVSSFYNQVESITVSKSQTQKKLFQFLNVLYSIGLTGDYAASPLTLSVSHDPLKYLTAQCTRLLDFNNKYLNISHQLLHNQFLSLISKSSDPFQESPQFPNSELNLQNAEKQYLRPLGTQSSPLNFSLLNIFLNDPVPRLNENSVTFLFDSMVNKLSSNVALLDYFTKTFLKIDNYNIDFSNVTYDILIRIVHLANANLVVTGYLAANLLPIKHRDLSNIADTIEQYLRFLTDSLPMISHFYRALMADITPFTNSLLYAFYVLKLLKRSCQPDLIAPIIELCYTVLLKSKSSELSVLNLIDCIFTANPDQLQVKDVNQISERLTKADVHFQEFNFLIQMLTNIAVNESNKSKILSSNVFKNILQINVISASTNFQAGNLYHHQLPDESHSMFCHLLTLVSLLIQLHHDNPQVLHFSLSFITKYQKRYEMILGVGTLAETNNSQRFDLTLQYQNQAFLEELALILSNVAIVAQESDYWINKNRNQFLTILHILISYTIKIFSHELFNQNYNSTRFSQFLAVSDRFNPVSRFESLLQSILIKSAVHTVPVRPQGSIMKSAYDPKTSLHSELNRFKDFKNVFLTQSVQSSNLFAFILEAIVCEALLSLGSALSSMMEVADFEEIYSNPTNNAFDQLFFKNFNHTLIDIQLFLLYAYQKLSIYPETYKDGCVHLQMVATSVEAKIQSRGILNLIAIYSLPEIKNVVRKAFEMSFYLQTLSFQIFDRIDIRNKHFYIDELKRQQEKSRMLLQDFESYMVRRENITSSLQPKDQMKFYSPIKSPYKSVAKFTPKNLALEFANADEEEIQRTLVSGRSLDIHAKFLEFIKNYYNIK